MTRRIGTNQALFILAAVAGALGLAASAGCKKQQQPAPQQKRQLTVAVASNMQFAFADIQAAFTAAHPDIELKTSYGSSGNFVNQITNGAPFDLFLSADTQYPDALVAKGLADKTAEFKYAIGRLVLWARNDAPVTFPVVPGTMREADLATLADDKIRKIAIANPKVAPYGRAAVAALEKAGVYDKVKDKLVLGENVSQTAQFASSGSADIGIIPLSLALVPEMKKIGNYREVDPSTYPVIEQAGVIPNSTRDKAAAEQLRGFILSKQGRDILNRYGFAPPGE